MCVYSPYQVYVFNAVAAAFIIRQHRQYFVILDSSNNPPPRPVCPKNVVGHRTGAVLPAAAGRLLKHWELLDKAAGAGKSLLQTLQTLLRVQVFEEDSTAALAGAEDAFSSRRGNASSKPTAL